MVASATPARVLLSASAEATSALAEALGRVLPAGTVVALDGDLGAGKTCFVRGLARGLGIADVVASPTYTLMQAFEGGRLPLYHFDAWMEGREKALFADGGDEWLRAGGIAVVEWAERVAEWLPEPRLAVRLEHAGPDLRVLRLRVVGEPGTPLAGRIAALALPAGISEGEGPSRPAGDPNSGPG